MLLGLLAAIALAPVYWLVVPARWRRDVLAAASLLALGLFDPRLPLLLLVCTFGLAAVLRGMAAGTDARRRALGVLAVALLVALFVVNKLAGGRLNVLPSQSGVLFLGVSFLVLKMAGATIDGARGTLGPAGVRDVLAWLVFLPTYPSGPMETFAHFRDQSPAWERLRGLGGLERILFGLVKAQVFAHQLGEWVDPILSSPGSASPPVLLLALYGLAARLYFDLAGYSDIAIGLAALYGYDIAENFDRPFAARNIALLWQRWHITLTGWLRTYVFTPVARGLMRRSGGRGDRLAVAAGLLADPPAHRAVARIPVELRRLWPAARAGGGVGECVRARLRPARAPDGHGPVVAPEPRGLRTERRVDRNRFRVDRHLRGHRCVVRRPLPPGARWTLTQRPRLGGHVRRRDRPARRALTGAKGDR